MRGLKRRRFTGFIRIAIRRLTAGHTRSKRDTREKSKTKIPEHGHTRVMK